MNYRFSLATSPLLNVLVPRGAHIIRRIRFFGSSASHDSPSRCNSSTGTTVITGIMARWKPSLAIALGALLLASSLALLPTVEAQEEQEEDERALDDPVKDEFTKLVSNLGKSSATNGHVLKSTMIAQAFTTGSSDRLLSAVTLDFKTAGSKGDRAYVQIWTEDGGMPGVSLGEFWLRNSMAVPGTGEETYHRRFSGKASTQSTLKSEG